MSFKRIYWRGVDFLMLVQNCSSKHRCCVYGSKGSETTFLSACRRIKIKRIQSRKAQVEWQETIPKIEGRQLKEGCERTRTCYSFSRWSTAEFQHTAFVIPAKDEDISLFLFSSTLSLSTSEAPWLSVPHKGLYSQEQLNPHLKLLTSTIIF